VLEFPATPNHANRDATKGGITVDKIKPVCPVERNIGGGGRAHHHELVFLRPAGDLKFASLLITPLACRFCGRTATQQDWADLLQGGTGRG